MKKLIFGLISLGFIRPLWADSITSGSIGLLKPSTGVVGGRNWGDKLNGNFDMIAASITGIINGTLGGSNPSIQNPATGYFNMNNQGAITNSTGLGTGYLQAEGSATIRGVLISSTGYLVGPSTVQGRFMLEGGSIQIRNGTNEFTLTIATPPIAGQKIGVLEVVGTRVLLGGTGDGGGGGGGGGGGSGFIFDGVNNISYSTFSITNANVNSDGQGFSTITIATPKTWDVIIGTPGCSGCDYNGTSIATMTNQAYSDRKVSIGANGFISSNTVPLSIFFRPGVYNGSRSTCPAFVSWYTPKNSSGTIFAVDDTSANIVMNYGTIDGFVFDGGSRPFVNALVSMKYNSVLKNATFIGCQAMANYNYRAALIEVVDSSQTRIHDNWLKQYHGCAGIVFQGQCGAIRVYNSIDSEIYNNLFSSPVYIGSAYENSFVTYNSSNINFHDNTIEGMSGSAISVNTQCRNVRLTRNVIKMGDGSVSDHANYGVVTFDSDGPGQGSSSSTIADSNQFIFISTGGGSGQPTQIFRSRSVPTPPWNGILITNNTVTSRARSNWGFYQQLGGTVFNTILANNYVYNLSSFVARDDGFGTRAKGFGNFLDGVPVDADYGVFSGSVTAYRGFTSTVGFIGASSTFSYMSVSTMIATSSGTFRTLTASSFTISGGTVCFGENCMFFSTSPLPGVDLILHYFNGKAYFGGDGGGSAGGSGEIRPGLDVFQGQIEISSPTFTMLFSSNHFNLDASPTNPSTATIRISSGITVFSIGAAFNGDGISIPISSSTVITTPFTGFITSMTILSPNDSGQIRVNVKKATYNQFPTFTSICAAACPSLSGSNQKNVNSALSGWDRAVNYGDTFILNLDTAATTISNVTVQIYGFKQ